MEGTSIEQLRQFIESLSDEERKKLEEILKVENDGICK